MHTCKVGYSHRRQIWGCEISVETKCQIKLFVTLIFDTHFQIQRFFFEDNFVCESELFINPNFSCLFRILEFKNKSIIGLLPTLRSKPSHFVTYSRCLSVLDFWNVNLGVCYKLEKKIDFESNLIFFQVRTWFLLPV